MTQVDAIAQMRWTSRDVFSLVLVLTFATILRCAFFTGFYGADEVVYLQMALGIWRGTWLPSEYIGAIRYGVNIPMAMFMTMFGASEFAAGLWSLMTSVGEVALVFVMARQCWGLRAALFASLCLAALPLHAHLAGRLMADSPLAFFLTASFVLTWMAERSGSAKLYFLTGLAIGAMFWIKDAVFYLTLLVLALYVLLTWRWHIRWFWSAGAALAMVLANSILLWKVHGDSLYLFTVLQNSLGNLPTASKTSIVYYLDYLLLDLKHTWLLFYLALGGVVVIVRRKRLFGVFKHPEAFVLLWTFGFICILSLLVLRQTNYMLIFAAPLALLAGYFLANISRTWQWPLISLFVAGGVALAAFEQQAVQTFTANSRASVAFANEHPHSIVFAGQGARRAYVYQKLLGNAPPDSLPVQSWSDMDKILRNDRSTDARTPDLASATTAYLIKDPQMARWGEQLDSTWTARFASTCLVRHSPIQPAPLGLGRYVTDAVFAASALLPSNIGNRLRSSLSNTLRPLPAEVFTITAPCFLPISTTKISSLP